MKHWEVAVWTGGETMPVRIKVDAEDQWRAILAAGRTGQVPLAVNEIRVSLISDTPQWG